MAHGKWITLGEDMDNLEVLVKKSGVHVHLYGEAEAKPVEKWATQTSRLAATDSMIL